MDQLVIGYNSKLKNISIEYKTFFIDMYQESEKWNLYDDLLSDGLHLSKSGHIKVSKIISKHILNKYKWTLFY